MSTAFRIQMSGANEVPPNASTASGLGAVLYDSTANTATYEITVTGLDWGATLGGPAQTANPNDNVSAMHVHNAAPGVNGPVVFGQIGPAHDVDDFSAVINGDGSTTIEGIWETTDGGTGLASFQAAMAAATAGTTINLYFNTHTSGFPGGEIRGQWVCIADDFANNVAGTGGNDILPGLGGNDTVNGFGGADDLAGGDLRDRLTGGNGNDTLDGGTGKDFIRGDAGQDALRGGGGKDKFVFENITDSAVFAPDRIFDYNPGAGEVIDLTAIDAQPSTGGDQAFVIVGSFGGNEGEAVLTYDAGLNRTTLELDQNGDNEADFALVINGDQTAGTGLLL